jgi:hypothetical protein
MPKCQNDHEVPLSLARCAQCGSPNPGYAARLVANNPRYQGPGGKVQRIARTTPQGQRIQPRVNPDFKPAVNAELASARQKLQELHGKIEVMKTQLEPAHVDQLSKLSSTLARFVEATVDDATADRTVSAHGKLQAQFIAILKEAKQAREAASNEALASTGADRGKDAPNLADIDGKLIELFGFLNSSSPAEFKAATKELWSRYTTAMTLEDDDEDKLDEFVAVHDKASQLKQAVEQKLQIIEQVLRDLRDIKGLLAELAFPPPLAGIAKLRARHEGAAKAVKSTNAGPQAVEAASSLLRELNELPQVKQIKKDSAANAKKAVEQVTALDRDALKDLDVEKRTQLLLNLRRGGGTGDEACREAMIKLHQAVPLERAFKAKDKKARQAVEDQLVASKALQDARRDWDTLDDDERSAALGEALRLQCKTMKELWGVEFAVPPVDLFDAAGTTDAETGEELCESGGFEPGTGRIKLNALAPSFGNFDQALNTIIHENTHNFQHALVQALEANRIDKDKEPEKYEQALLFQLNMPPLGYLNPSDVDADSEHGNAYELQATERHAYKAGKKAEELSQRFQLAAVRADLEADAEADRLKLAKEEAQSTLDKLRAVSGMLAKLVPGFQGAASVQADLEAALQSDTSSVVMDASEVAFTKLMELMDMVNS